MRRESESLVSMLMPCFNAERYLTAAVKSTLAQTWPNKEIVAVDDGSTDASLHVLKGLEELGVRVIAQENRGAAAARNTAYAASRGEYVKFCDADDLLHPEMIERQMQRLEGSQADVASAEWGRFYNDDLGTFQLSSEVVWRDMGAQEWLVEAWMGARPMMQPAMWLIPRRLLEISGAWNEQLSLIDDFEFFTRVLCNAEEVRFTPKTPVYYRSGVASSLSQQKSRRAVKSACQSLLLGTSHLLSKRLDERARLACANILQDFVYTYYPEHADLRRRVTARIVELGGSNLAPSGPPRFEQLRALVGWRAARLVQRAAYQVGYRSRRATSLR